MGGAGACWLPSFKGEGQRPFHEGTGGMVTWRYVTAGYFKTLGIPIVRGRGFREEDRAPAEHAVVLSESLARRLFPIGDAVGKRIKTEPWNTERGEAAGVRNLRPW